MRTTSTRAIQLLLVFAVWTLAITATTTHAQSTTTANNDTTTVADPDKPQIGNDHPFVEFNGLTDGSWAVFIMITVTAATFGVYFPKIGLPLITGTQMRLQQPFAWSILSLLFHSLTRLLGSNLT